VITIQGCTVADYVRHAEELAPLIFKLRHWTYNRASYDLDEADPAVLNRRQQQFRVGIGSLCQQQQHAEQLAPLIFKLRNWIYNRASYELDEVGDPVLDRWQEQSRVGIGGLCRRNSVRHIGPIVDAVASVLEGVPLHHLLKNASGCHLSF
jgi:hypothetical protein